jgi:hypothetical protein
MSQTLSGILLLSIIVGMLIAGLIFTIHYFVRVADHVKKTTLNVFQIKELMASLYISQGSNFNTVMLFSWSIFLVAFAFLFFMTPEILGTWSYFNVHAASDSFGLAYFGIAVIIAQSVLVAPLVPQVYGYYRISKHLKQLSILTPIFLLTSISCSVYLGTIYPTTNPFYFFIGYISLLISLSLMLAPIVKGYIEEMRT